MYITVENLVHFKCENPNCTVEFNGEKGGWFSIGDFHKIFIPALFCPFCGKAFMVEKDQILLK